MELPAGVAPNAALRENVFVALVCILNHFPVFLLGKPGGGEAGPGGGEAGLGGGEAGCTHTHTQAGSPSIAHDINGYDAHMPKTSLTPASYTYVQLCTGPQHTRTQARTHAHMHNCPR